VLCLIGAGLIGSVAGAAACSARSTADPGVTDSPTATAYASPGAASPGDASPADASPGTPSPEPDLAFLGGNPHPAPEATITPEPGSYGDPVPPAGYRVVLVSAPGAQQGDDRATARLAEAVRAWADRHDVHLTEMTASGRDEVTAAGHRAVAQHPDLVIGVGTGVTDVWARYTAGVLHQEFLLLGTQLPEPTYNVSSVIWTGATFRGDGLTSSGGVDPAAVTPERSADAVDAGITSVLLDRTGLVVWLE